MTSWTSCGLYGSRSKKIGTLLLNLNICFMFKDNKKEIHKIFGRFSAALAALAQRKAKTMQKRALMLNLFI